MKRLDRIDHAIVLALQEDGRLSNKELAARVGLSPSSCLERVRRLRTDGVIRGFAADLDPAALGIGLQAMVSVRLSTHAPAALDDLRAWLLARPEVIAVYHLAGAADLLVHVAVRDSSHLREIALDGITARDEVARIETWLVFSHHRSHGLPDYAADE